MLTVNNQSDLEQLIINFLENKGVIYPDSQRTDLRSPEGEYELSSLYQHLSPESRPLFTLACVRMLQEYERLAEEYSAFSGRVSLDFLQEMELMVAHEGLDLTATLPSIYNYVENLTLLKRSELHHRRMINVLGEVGKTGISPEAWRKLYDHQPDSCKAQMHMAIVYANSDLAEELAPDLRKKVDKDTYLKNIFFMIRRKYNPDHAAENNPLTKSKLLQYATREEWLSTEFGSGFTAQGIEKYFGN